MGVTTSKPDTVKHWGSIDKFNLKTTIQRARQELPPEWHHIIGMEASAARAFHMRYASTDPVAAKRVWDGYLDQYGGALASNLSDGQIKAQARAYSKEAGDLDIGELTANGPWGEYARLLDFCEAREVAAPPVKLLLRGMSKRVRCQYWWRRALRKMVAQKSERGHMAMGLVSASNHQPYASNQSVFRRIAQNERNRVALESITMENEDGYRQTLAELSAKSVANKAIRRGELMTRIRGCQEIADECGHAGLFVTGTCPSRFHSTLRNGRRNPKFNGSTPRDAQDWLCDKWEKTRAKLARQGVKVYGFRVAEPHHDGCTHWHMLIWAADGLDKFEAVMRAYWLSDAGDEPGAKKYRVQFKPMLPGGAASYLAKYISKNIDDHGIESHLDDYATSSIGPDLLGDTEIKPCLRVESWAASWKIRQFQPLGQPPVTVWRELRRVTEKNARLAGVGGVVHQAWLACQKTGTDRASWARYCKAQGGLMRGRKCNIKMSHDRREVVGLYGRDMRNVPISVRLNCTMAKTVWSERKLWTVVETCAATLPASFPAPVLECASDKRSASARTRVNNCTAAVEAVRLESQDTPEKRALLEKMERDFHAEFPYARSLPDVNGMKEYFSD